MRLDILFLLATALVVPGSSMRVHAQAESNNEGADTVLESQFRKTRIKQVRWSPGGGYFGIVEMPEADLTDVAHSINQAATGQQTTLRVFDARTQKEVWHRDPGNDEVHDFEFLSESDLVYCRTQKGFSNPTKKNYSASWVNFVTGKEEYTFPETFGTESCAVSKDRKLLAFSIMLGKSEMQIWDLDKRKMVFNDTSGLVASVAVSADGKWAAIGYRGKKTALVDIGKSRIVAEFADEFRSAISIAFSPDNKFVAVGGQNQKVCVYDVQLKERKADMVVVDASLIKVGFLPTGELVVAGSRSLKDKKTQGTLMVVADWKKGNVGRTYSTKSFVPVIAFAFSPGNDQWAIGSFAGLSLLRP